MAKILNVRAEIPREYQRNISLFLYLIKLMRKIWAKNRNNSPVVSGFMSVKNPNFNGANRYNKDPINATRFLLNIFFSRKKRVTHDASEIVKYINLMRKISKEILFIFNTFCRISVGLSKI